MTPRRRRAAAPTPPAGLPGPDALEVDAQALRAGGTLCRTFAVVGYPREVGPGWLEPLLGHQGPVDVAVHVEPVPPQVAAERLRRQLARLESSRRLDADHGRLADFGAEAAAEDAHGLARRLARGDTRLFRVGLYVTVRGRDPAELDAECARVQGLLASLLLDARPATFRQLQGWITTLPLGLDLLKLRRSFDSDALAASFPFAAADLNAAGGVLYGRNPQKPGADSAGEVGGSRDQAVVRPWAVHSAWMRVGRRGAGGRGAKWAPSRVMFRAMPVKMFCRWALGRPR
jgi:hypothetical protein